jgi:hypothetical protein
MTCEDVPAPPLVNNFVPDEIILYGVKINSGTNQGTVHFEGKRLLLEVRPLDSEETIGPDKIAMAVIYGYAYEGHCYRLDKPKLVVFEYVRSERPANGCGFDESYSMWRVRSKLTMIELTTTVDLAETLILEANLPGNRAPNTYGNSMQMAHRGNRLTRGNGGG